MVSLTPAQFNHGFASELSADESKKVYDEFHIPAAAHVLWQYALGLPLHGYGAGAVDFTKGDRAPPLLIGGELDNVIPPAIPKATLKRYNGPAIVDYKEFHRSTRHITRQSGWEAVADYSLEWAKALVVDD